MTRIKPQRQESGFALLMTLIVVGVVLSIGLSLLDLSIKQVKLSTMAKDSEIAFHAANAGMECARYTRNINGTSTESGSSITPACFSVAVGTNDEFPDHYFTPGGSIHKYVYDFTWDPSGTERCTKVVMLVAVATFNGPGISASSTDIIIDIPGYPVGQDFKCDAGGRCTVISVRGYNKACGATNTPGTIEREVLVEF